MNLFGKTNKKRSPRRKLTLEEREQARKDNEVAYASQLLRKRTATNPGLEDSYIEHYTGVIIPKEGGEDLDTRDFKRDIRKAAMEQVKKDPELMEKYGQQELDKSLGYDNNDGAYYHGDGEDYGPPDNRTGGISGILNDLDSFEELQKRLGGSNSQGALGGLLTPEVLTGIISLTQSIITGKSGNGGAPPAPTQPPEKVYQIEVDGKPMLITETELRKEQLRLAAAPPAPTEVDEPPAPTEESAGDTAQVDPGILEFIDPDTVMNLMVMSPDDAADSIREGMTTGDEDMSSLGTILLLTPIEKIFDELKKHTDDETYGAYVEKLVNEPGCDWLKHVVEKLHVNEPTAG